MLDLSPHLPPAVARPSPKPGMWLSAPWSSLPQGRREAAQCLQQFHLRNHRQPQEEPSRPSVPTGALHTVPRIPLKKTASLPRAPVAKAVSRFSPAQSPHTFQSCHVQSLKVWCLSGFPCPLPTPPVPSGCVWEVPGSRRTLGTQTRNPSLPPDLDLGSTEDTPF